LLLDVDVRRRVEPGLDHRLNRAFGVREAALLQAEVLTHTDLVAVAQHRRGTSLADG
jgi:hypothetical protein